MSDSRWQEMWGLFHDLLDRPAEELPAGLAAIEDPALRREVQELLEAHHETAQLLDAPASATEPDPLLGTQLGPYKLLELIGEGGMGVVYVAEQSGEVRRQVALKVIKLGMDTKEVVARFESERQALAMMNHAHIAQVYDVGATPDGRPYFVMEHVAGIPIHDYCDTYRLPLAERLRLFRFVCDAVQHAHQKGIIHRDLKPANVLVTVQDGEPSPKIIDFGVAKAIERRLTDKSLHTELGRFIGTPEYMSPEQAEMSGLDVDTRSDIYSLGVLLYQLVVGTLPFDSDTLRTADYGEIQRILREDEPPRPSSRWRSLETEEAEMAARHRRSSRAAMARELAGELDWITMKAMEKDRTRRYANASELAADLERYLHDLPVLAGPPSTAYRLRKFARRHRFGVTTTAAGLLLVAAFLTSVMVQSARTTRALKLAETERASAEQVSEFLAALFVGADPFREEPEDLTAREILDRGAERISTELAGQPEVQSALLTLVGRVSSNLGHLDRAQQLLERALQLRLQQEGVDPLDVAEVEHQLAHVFEGKGEYDRAEEFARRALETRRRILGDDDSDVVRDAAFLGWVLGRRGSYEEGEELLLEAVERLQRIEPEGATLARALDQLAILRQLQGDYSGAEAYLKEAISRYRRLFGETYPEVASALNRLGALRNEHGDYRAAEETLREALRLAKMTLDDDHRIVLGIENNLALALYNAGDFENAEPLYRSTLEAERRKAGGDHPRVAVSLNNLGLLLLDRGDLDGAEELFREALAMQERLVGPAHPNVAFHLNNLGRVLHRRGDLDGAESLYRRALDIRRRALPPGHVQTAASLTWLGELMDKRGAAQEAETLLREALDIRRRVLADDDWRTAHTASLLGACLVHLRRYEEAEPLLLESAPLIERRRGRRHRQTREAVERIVELYEAWGRPERAAEVRARLNADDLRKDSEADARRR